MSIAPPSVNPLLDLQPSFATVTGTSATWSFKGEIISWYGGPGAEGAPFEGTVTLTILGDDTDPVDPCAAYRPTTTSFTYTVNGVTHTLSGRGTAVSYADCFGNVEGPRIQINATPPDYYWTVEVYNPADGEDFPLTPPALGAWPYVFSTGQISTREGFMALLSELTGGPGRPTLKDECFRGGWKAFGFKNEGQCVKYVETGKDTR